MFLAGLQSGPVAAFPFVRQVVSGIDMNRNDLGAVLDPGPQTTKHPRNETLLDLTGIS
jgi:hypothetical protein